MSANITFRGILDTAFDNFLCLRGFARIGDLADASEADSETFKFKLSSRYYAQKQAMCVRVTTMA